MLDAYREHGDTLREIGEHAGFHDATVSRIVAHAEAAETDVTTNKT